MTMRRLIPVCVMILCLSLTGCSTLQSNSREAMARWVADNRETWKKIVSAPQPAGSIRYDRELAGLWSRLFRDGRLSDVCYAPDTGDYSLYFNGAAEPPEGDRYLIWSRRTAEDVAPLLPDDPGTLEEKSETRLYRTGIGAGGRGYVLVEQIDENWFYVEYNVPT